MYQVRTCRHLKPSKKYFMTMKEVKAWVHLVIKSTMEFTKDLEDTQLRYFDAHRKLGKDALTVSIHITNIDTDLLPEYTKCFGTPMGIGSMSKTKYPDISTHEDAKLPSES